MSKIALRYNYINESGEKMMYLCQAVVSQHNTLGAVSRSVHATLERDCGPIAELILVAQNDPLDIKMLKAMGATNDTETD